MVRFAPVLWNILLLLQDPQVISAPDILRPGEVGILYFWDPREGRNDRVTARVQVLSSKDRVITTAPFFPWRQNSGFDGVQVAFLGLGADFPPGSYRLNIQTDVLPDLDTPGAPDHFDGGILDVKPRSFRETVLRVTRAMRAVQTSPDPRRLEQSRELTEVLETFNLRALLNQDSFLKPLRAAYRSTSQYGDRRRQVNPDRSSSVTIHYGTDLAAPRGTPVYSPGAGRVVLAENRILTGWTLVMEHYPGVYTMFYHMDSINARVGRLYRAGDPLGFLGSTGFSTGPHLHWEVRVNSQAVDPLSLLGKPLIDKEQFFTIIARAFMQKRG